MSRVAVTLDEVATFASELPEVVEADRRGSRIWSVRDKTFAWERTFSKADIRRYGDEDPPGGPILAIRTADLGEKEAVLAGQPPWVFTIPHFDGYAAVLVHLERAEGRVVRELLEDGWYACAPPALASGYRTRGDL
jgi:hypothetical protein